MSAKVNQNGRDNNVKSVNSMEYMNGLKSDEKSQHRMAFLHLQSMMVGSEVEIDAVDGVIAQGIFHCSTPFPHQKYQVVVKALKIVKDPTDSNKNDKAAMAYGSTLIMEDQSFLGYKTIQKLDLNMRNINNEFQTDSSIRKQDLSHLHGRDLESVSNAWLDPETSTEIASGTNIAWDQFETNRRLFNVKSSYDENIYTKKIDIKSMTQEQVLKADRIAKEIEMASSGNIHLQEERNQLEGRDFNEEDMYSGVVREKPATVRTTGPRSSERPSQSLRAGPDGDTWKKKVLPKSPDESSDGTKTYTPGGSMRFMPRSTDPRVSQSPDLSRSPLGSQTFSPSEQMENSPQKHELVTNPDPGNVSADCPAGTDIATLSIGNVEVPLSSGIMKDDVKISEDNSEERSDSATNHTDSDKDTKSGSSGTSKTTFKLNPMVKEFVPGSFGKPPGGSDKGSTSAGPTPAIIPGPGYYGPRFNPSNAGKPGHPYPSGEQGDLQSMGSGNMEQMQGNLPAEFSFPPGGVIMPGQFHPTNPDVQLMQGMSFDNPGYGMVNMGPGYNNVGAGMMDMSNFWNANNVRLPMNPSNYMQMPQPPPNGLYPPYFTPTSMPGYHQTYVMPAMYPPQNMGYNNQMDQILSNNGIGMQGGYNNNLPMPNAVLANQSPSMNSNHLQSQSYKNSSISNPNNANHNSNQRTAPADGNFNSLGDKNVSNNTSQDVAKDRNERERNFGGGPPGNGAGGKPRNGSSGIINRNKNFSNNNNAN